MKIGNLLLFLLISFAVESPATRSQSQRLELPQQARDQLYVKFPDWQFAKVSDEIREVFKKDYRPNSRPDLITGDFDSDGKVDCAALISHGTIRVEKREIIYPQDCLAVFLAQDQGYQLHIIEDVNADYIQLIHKGDGGYDYETQKEFTFLHDAIDAVIFEKAATSYVYDRGRFRAIITSD